MAISRGLEGTRPARRPCAETLVVGAICLVDLVVTAVLLHLGLAEEANPIMGYFASYGIAAFCVAKLLFVIPPLLVAEWYRRWNDRLVRTMLRVVAFTYLVVWAGATLTLNAHLLGL
ncbi:MAG: hypothetical protein GX785_10875 [Armatimonadetes bacterium]|jgi:hypothetical protein|nr:hypothetical protein [Armatimonadota bacterium]HOM81609.1 DUF5658 family protein [Armatimonadota bacterium]HPO74724.1 DUF5658 family protein [Armatimonadota bacterium]